MIPRCSVGPLLMVYTLSGLPHPHLGLHFVHSWSRTRQFLCALNWHFQPFPWHLPLGVFRDLKFQVSWTKHLLKSISPSLAPLLGAQTRNGSRLAFPQLHYELILRSCWPPSAFRITLPTCSSIVSPWRSNCLCYPNWSLCFRFALLQFIPFYRYCYFFPKPKRPCNSFSKNSSLAS